MTICETCGTFFTAVSNSQRYCKPVCRVWKRRSRSLSELESRQFIGVDGEGVTDPDGSHRYVLLSVGNDSLTIRDKGSTLSFHEIMPFLWECYLKHPNAIFVGFYLTYDFSQWFRSLPEERARMAFTERGRLMRQPKSEKLHGRPFPVYYAGWQFDMLGGRRFKLAPEGHRGGYMYICDVGSFWQTSLMAAIDPSRWSEPIINKKQYAIIAEGKQQRATATLSKSMIKYNVTENAALAAIMTQLERGFHANGWNIKKSHYFGPGQAAQLWLNNIHAPTRDDIGEATPKAVLRAAQASYYGGRFEIPVHGYVSGTSYEYDINSAYPYAISELPCLLHGTWKHDSNADLVLMKVTTTGNNKYLGGLPHRNDKGIIAYPQNVTGWYWRKEIEAAQKAGLINTVTVHEVHSYHPCKCAPPLYDIARLYEQRLKVGKNTAQGIALKLVYNSAYGKTAQSIGNPKYANPVYASLITSSCRTSILNAIATHPVGAADVMMIATDGLYMRSPHPYLTLSSDTLGSWDKGEKHNLTLFRPGVYWDDKARNTINNTPTLKSRGINAYELAKHVTWIDEQFKQFPKHGEWPSVTIPIRFSVTSHTLALARNKWRTCGSVTSYDKNGTVQELTSEPSNKRNVNWYVDGDLIRTPVYRDLGPTHGYNKTFGMSLQALIDNDAFITDDGTIAQELRDHLGML